MGNNNVKSVPIDTPNVPSKPLAVKSAYHGQSLGDFLSERVHDMYTGYNIVYCGDVSCREHRDSTGSIRIRTTPSYSGNDRIDIKVYPGEKDVSVELVYVGVDGEKTNLGDFVMKVGGIPTFTTMQSSHTTWYLHDVMKAVCDNREFPHPGDKGCNDPTVSIIVIPGQIVILAKKLM